MRDDKVEEEVLQTKFNKEFGPGLLQPSNMKDKNSASVFSNKCNQCNKTFKSILRKTHFLVQYNFLSHIFDKSINVNLQDIYAEK